MSRRRWLVPLLTLTRVSATRVLPRRVRAGATGWEEPTAAPLLPLPPPLPRPPTLPNPPTTFSSDTTAFIGSINGGPGPPEWAGIPRPILDGSVEGYRYLGEGQFMTETGREVLARRPL